MRTYFWKKGVLHIQFEVVDLDRAWRCARDAENFLKQVAPDADLQQTKWAKAQEKDAAGDKFDTFKATQTEEIDGKKHEMEMQYSVVEVSEASRSIEYEVTRFLDGERKSTFQMNVQVGEPRKRKISNIVMITSSEKEKHGIYNSHLARIALFTAMFPFRFVAHRLGIHTKADEKTEISWMAHRLQQHFLNFQVPAEVVDVDVPMASIIEVKADAI